MSEMDANAIAELRRDVERYSHLYVASQSERIQQAGKLLQAQHRIAFLEKALDQATELGQLKISGQDANSTPGFVLCDACMVDVPIEKAAELAAYLRERDKRERDKRCPTCGAETQGQHGVAYVYKPECGPEVRDIRSEAVTFCPNGCDIGPPYEIEDGKVICRSEPPC